MRKIVIAGNWKMYKNRLEAKAFLSAFLPKLQDSAKSTANFPLVAIFAPFTQLQTVVETAANFSDYVRIGAQNVHWADEGAFTGEISAPMLKDIGIDYVIVGHSERRQYFGETDETVNKRLKAAQQHGLTPILCVGESKQQRDAGEIESVIIAQLKHGLVGIDQHNLIIAYEPIWAIGTGDTCEVSEANRVIGIIRQQLTNPHITIQYGGSVKPDNIDEIMSQSEIDGALVGGASLDVDSFTRIINYQPI